jgi:predicted HicB family RNase H-like nuclease
MINSMSYKGYTVSMTFDVDDKIIIGRVLDVDDIIVFHGASVAEFEQAFHASIDDYIMACEQLGQAPEKPVSGRLMLRIAPNIHAAAIKAAAHDGQSMNKWVEQLLSRVLNHPNSSMNHGV